MARFSKNRLFSRLVKQFNEDLTIKTEGLEASTRNSISGSLDSAAVNSLITANALDSAAVTSLITTNSTPGVTLNTTLDSLGDTSGLDIGTLKYISEANRLFVWSGSAWETISLTNNVPTFDSNGLADSSYSLARDGTPTIINLSATDPEGVPLAWSYAVTSGTLGNTATILQDSSEFTITPSTNENDDGQFQITFSGSDGKNTITSVSNFSLTFPVTPGEQTFTNQNNTFTVPAGVYNVSVVCIGGGGNGSYARGTGAWSGGSSSFGISGQSFYFGAYGGGAGGNSAGGAGGGRFGAYDGGGNGGNGSNGTMNSAGGGAGGYSGNGGSAVGSSGSSAGPGGGVGSFGEGASGAPASTNAYGTSYGGSGGGGGSGGSCANYSCGSNIYGWSGSGGQGYESTDRNRAYRTNFWGGGNASAGGGGGGGGGGLAYKNNISVTPGQQITVTVGRGGNNGYNSASQGVVRIIWPAYDAANGLTRSFPSTNTGASADIIP